MPMGIVSDSDFNKELEKNQTPSTAVIKDINKGRGNGNVEVPNALRKVIGETSEIDGRQAAIDLASSFGISPSSVSAYSNGATSTASYADQPNKSHLEEAKERISKKARNKLLLAMNHITKEKLVDAPARILAGIAKDMSAVVKNMEPDTPKSTVENNNGPQFVIYAPQYRKEEHFEVVQAKE
jgi:hypothetical protein